MNTKPRNQCVPADLVWLVLLDHQRQRGSLHVAERNAGREPCPGTPSTHTCCQTNKTLESIASPDFFSFLSPVSARSWGGSPGSCEWDRLMLAGLWGGAA